MTSESQNDEKLPSVLWSDPNSILIIQFISILVETVGDIHVMECVDGIIISVVFYALSE